MNIKHHLDEATLVSYTAGAMSQSMALVVASHISMCPVCQERVQNTQKIGGMILESLKPVAINDDTLSKLLLRIDQELQSADPEPQAVYDLVKDAHKKHSNANVPAPLSDFIGHSFDTLDWKCIVPGIYYHDLPCDTEHAGVSRLLRIAPGKEMLLHSHDGNELTLILRGSISDEIGRFTVGDVADLDNEIEHQPLVDSAEDCICLVATDAPLKFRTLLGKIVQPITGC